LLDPKSLRSGASMTVAVLISPLGNSEQETTEETEGKYSDSSVDSLTHSKLAPGRINLDKPSVNLTTLKLMIKPNGISEDAS
jgi:hypothetical protein